MTLSSMDTIVDAMLVTALVGVFLLVVARMTGRSIPPSSDDTDLWMWLESREPPAYDERRDGDS